MTTEVTEAIPESLEATIQEYHRVLNNRLQSTQDIMRFYASGSLVVQIDGRLLQAKGRPRVGTGDASRFWIQRLYFQHGCKADMETVELRISNDSAHEIYHFEYNFNLPHDYPSPMIEEGHYLAVWNYSPEDQRWLITAPGFQLSGYRTVEGVG